MSSAFDPILAYELISSEQAQELQDTMRNYRKQIDIFLEDEEADPVKASDMLKAIKRIDRVYEEIVDEIYRVPAIVHIAGEYKEETNPENNEQIATIQRCSRCGSMLQFWFEGIMYLGVDGSIREFSEDDAQWWDVGEQVAKQDAPGHVDMYSVEGKALERWETECADLSGLEDILDGLTEEE